MNTPIPAAMPPEPEIAVEAAPAFDPLHVLAELDLTRRKADLLERRIASWEDELIQLQKRVTALEKARDPEGPEFTSKQRDLEHRMGRLERRREAEAAPPPPAASSASMALDYQPDDLNAVALVRARWVTTNQALKPGAEVEMVATTDGLAANAEVTFFVRSLVEDKPLAQIKGRCDGDRAYGRWTLPKDLPFRELFFEVIHGEALARSPILVLPEA
ncbi:hypothetical protein KKF91_09885 [Myxococcota bacterium]|nr:hypothetical protein [Myxococcota bacterium]MBU1430853.1 hypothetical protein [Myxococcota bacterium]MBU1899034.1 hypothetical protein [Myxococcota bacterium]